MAKILIMEDDADIAGVWKQSLEIEGHEVTIAGNATTAWAALSETSHDLLITDVFVKADGKFVPDGGILLITRIRQTKSLEATPGPRRETPVIAVSGAPLGANGFDALNIALQVGADKALRKPFGIETLNSAVASLLPNDGDAF